MEINSGSHKSSELIQREPIDISMPGSMGVLTTGYAGQLDQAVMGGFKVLAKPMAPEELLTELRTALDGRG